RRPELRNRADAEPRAVVAVRRPDDLRLRDVPRRPRDLRRVELDRRGATVVAVLVIPVERDRDPGAEREEEHHDGGDGHFPHRAMMPRSPSAPSTERRRSRTYPAVGCTTSPVLKTGWATGPMPLRRRA